MSRGRKIAEYKKVAKFYSPNHLKQDFLWCQAEAWNTGNVKYIFS